MLRRINIKFIEFKKKTKNMNSSVKYHWDRRMLLERKLSVVGIPRYYTKWLVILHEIVRDTTRNTS